jgi:hypothetical protein
VRDKEHEPRARIRISFLE